MTERTVTHATFVIERRYKASPSRVFQAWADPVAKAKWFGGPDEWQSTPLTLDFRVGGRESVSGGPEGGTVHTYNATYQDIVPDCRIVTTYEMLMDDVRISVSVATVEFKPDGEGTRLVHTEQGAFLDGWDDAGQREAGTRELLDNLGAYVDAAGS